MDEFTRRRYVKIAGEYRQILHEGGGYVVACTYVAEKVPIQDLQEFQRIVEEMDNDLNSSD